MTAPKFSFNIGGTPAPATSSTSTGLFGSLTSTPAQQTTQSTSLFGASLSTPQQPQQQQTTGLTGSTSFGTGFGAAKPALGGFGTSTFGSSTSTETQSNFSFYNKKTNKLFIYFYLFI